MGQQKGMTNQVKTKIIEAEGNNFNWGKFLLGRLDSEWLIPSAVDIQYPGSLLHKVGFNPNQLWVMDLQTCEGAAFNATPNGHAAADLNKHAIWVCPLFQPFLEWLYKQDLTDLDALPSVVKLPHAEASMSGYRRPGPTGK